MKNKPHIQFKDGEWFAMLNGCVGYGYTPRSAVIHLEAVYKKYTHLTHLPWRIG